MEMNCLNVFIHAAIILLVVHMRWRENWMPNAMIGMNAVCLAWSVFTVLLKVFCAET
jgi:hypothetical protein